jgi:hypothetical protein
MPRYELTIAFDTDRYLTTEERGQLQLATIAQVEDPADENGNRAKFTTSLYGCDIFKVKVAK